MVRRIRSLDELLADPQAPSLLQDFDALNSRGPKWKCASDGNAELFPYREMGLDIRASRWIASNSDEINQPAQVYLVSHSSIQALKVGITSHATVSSRIDQHRRAGWRVEATWNVTSLRVAKSVEFAVIQWWRNEMCAVNTLGAEQMPQGGWTETAFLSDVGVAETQSFVTRLLTEEGLERVFELNCSDLQIGTLIEGSAEILATRWWYWAPKNTYGFIVPRSTGKILVGSTNHLLTLELSASAYGVRQFYFDVGDSVRFRGRVQRLGHAYRVVNPWLFDMKYGKPLLRPDPVFDVN